MAQVAAVIKVNESLIPIPPEAFPKNLSRTAREDSPETMFPILAYDGKNILPTPYGYRSYFAINEKLLRASIARILSTVRVEYIFWYQSVELDNILVALASNGIWITNTDIDTDWIRVVNLSAFDTDPNKRLQWTTCTINNFTFAYMQGIDAFYGLVDPARYAEAATPTIIQGATVSQVAINWNVGVLKYIPSFLNMSGQLGIFKAGNRLGFWDSDASVSWSSALFVEDFKPDIKTLAGFSKFADVVGTITKIVQHGDGFIIYATRSIIRCINNSNEKSKFSGSAILSSTGCLFDRQIAMAQPDTVHYVLTASGMYVIENFQAQPMATDILDGIIEENDYLSLDYVDGRYLFINTLNGWKGSDLDFEGVTYENGGHEYTFPPPVYPNPDITNDLLETLINGTNPDLPTAFEDFEPITPGVFPPAGKPLVPCYDLDKFKSTWGSTAFTPNPEGTELLDSRIRLGVTYLLDPIYVVPVVTVNSITSDTVDTDLAGQELEDALINALDECNGQLNYQLEWKNANANPIPVIAFGSGPAPDNWDGQPVVVQWEKELIEREVTPNCIDLRDLKVESNKCRTHMYFDKDRLGELLTYFEGTETYDGERTVYFYGGTTFSNPTNPYLGIPSNFSIQDSYIVVPYKPAIRTEWRNAMVAAGFGDPGDPVTGTVGGFTFPIIQNQYVTYCVFNYPEQCLFSGYIVDAEHYIEHINTRRGFGNASSDPIDLDPPSIQSFKAVVDGIPYVRPSADEAYAVNAGALVSPTNGGWGPFANSVNSNMTYLALGSGATGMWQNQTNTFTNAEKQAIWESIGGDFGGVIPAGYTLSGEITNTLEFIPNFPDKITVFDLKLSGFGYMSFGSFTKTLRRTSTTSCPLPVASYGGQLPTNEIDVNIPDREPPESVVIPPYEWDYPGSIALPPNYWLTKHGSASPLYPTFVKSLVYDTQLEKWGISNMAFKAICGMGPVNRSDETIVPVHDFGMLAAVLLADGTVAFIKPNTNETDSEITYGKIGQYRLGKSTLSYLKLYFKEQFSGTIIVETSNDGNTVDTTRAIAADFDNVKSALFPFTVKGDWFNIKVRGSFTLKHIECYIEGRSRR